MRDLDRRPNKALVLACLMLPSLTGCAGGEWPKNWDSFQQEMSSFLNPMLSKEKDASV